MADKHADKFISEAALSALLHAHDGHMALLYLYLLHAPDADAEQAAGALCLTLRDVEAAWEKLQRLGLIGHAEAMPASVSPSPVLGPAEELPQYTAAEISRRGQEDPAFSAVLDEAAKVMGRALSGNDMRVLFGVYDHLALPPEVILELLNYVGEVYQEKYGTERRPGARAIEQEAYTWANLELMTLDQTEAYIHKRKQLRTDLSRVRNLLGIHDRRLTPTEQKYIESWLTMGFPDEAIALALDRTVVKTGKLAWKYMNAILCDWHQKGLHEPREIEEKDPSGRQSSAAPRKGDKPVDLDELKRRVGKIRS